MFHINDQKMARWRNRLSVLRFRGRDESSIRTHRAMFQLRLHRGELLFALLLPLVFNLGIFLILDELILFWRTMLEFWVSRLQFDARVVMHVFDLGLYDLWLPSIAAEAPLPSAMTWWVTTLLCLVTFIVTYLLRPNRSLPLIYIVRALILIQITALLYFAFIPASFPSSLEEYVADNLFLGLLFLVLIPWILGLTYYLFDFSLLQKIVLTFLILTFFMVAFPLQYLLHANLVVHGSLLFMPILYLVFGLFIDVMAFVALYSYGMSWRFGIRSVLARLRPSFFR